RGYAWDGRLCSPGKRSAPGTWTPASAGDWRVVRRGGGPGCGLRPYPGYGATPGTGACVARVSEAHPGPGRQRAPGIGARSGVAEVPDAAYGLIRATWSS